MICERFRRYKNGCVRSDDIHKSKSISQKNCTSLWTAELSALLYDQILKHFSRLDLGNEIPNQQLVNKKWSFNLINVHNFNINMILSLIIKLLMNNNYE